MNCDYFITTDLYLIKKMNNFDGIKVVSPVDFINCVKQDEC
jgi:predicted nucleic acid-binding protein